MSGKRQDPPDEVPMRSELTQKKPKETDVVLKQNELELKNNDDDDNVDNDVDDEPDVAK